MMNLKITAPKLVQTVRTSDKRQVLATGIAFVWASDPLFGTAIPITHKFWATVVLIALAALTQMGADWGKNKAT